MGVPEWVDRVERAVDNPVQLAHLHEQIAGDITLSLDDRDLLGGRIATYLADQDRGSHFENETPDEISTAGLRSSKVPSPDGSVEWSPDGLPAIWEFALTFDPRGFASGGDLWRKRDQRTRSGWTAPTATLPLRQQGSPGPRGWSHA